jgi:large subunit ribosomal protein L7/L12
MLMERMTSGHDMKTVHAVKKFSNGFFHILLLLGSFMSLASLGRGLVRPLTSFSELSKPRLFASAPAESQFNVFAKMSDGVGVPSNTGDSKDKKRPPSKRVLELVDQILDLSLIEAADLCDICQERLSERSGGIPMRAPFVHPGAMFGTPMMGMPGMGQPMAPTAGGAPAAASGEPAKAKEKAAEPAAKEEEKSIVSVKLVSYAADKRVGVIKEVRGILGLGLKESKELVEGVPKVIKRGLPREEAEQLKTKLEAAGAVVEFS